MSIIAVIQARMSSSRMPGKVLRTLHGKPMLMHQLERVRQSANIDKLIVATSTDKSDDSIEAMCNCAAATSLDVNCYRGPLDDVLARFVGVANCFGGRHMVRLTGDCPLSDPKIIDEIVELHLTSDADYTSNVACPTLPDGFDVEVFRKSVLLEAADRAVFPSEREHVTPYIRYRSDHYRNVDYRYSRDLSHIRLTVDHPEDFDLISRVFDLLYPEKPHFSVEDVVEVLQSNPQWVALNSHIDGAQGYYKSLVADKEFLRRKKQEYQNAGMVVG